MYDIHMIIYDPILLFIYFIINKKKKYMNKYTIYIYIFLPLKEGLLYFISLKSKVIQGTSQSLLQLDSVDIIFLFDI